MYQVYKELRDRRKALSALGEDLSCRCVAIAAQSTNPVNLAAAVVKLIGTNFAGQQSPRSLGLSHGRLKGMPR